jgi:hypothetical protein
MQNLRPILVAARQLDPAPGPSKSMTPTMTKNGTLSNSTIFFPSGAEIVLSQR